MVYLYAVGRILEETQHDSLNSFCGIRLKLESLICKPGRIPKPLGFLIIE